MSFPRTPRLTVPSHRTNGLEKVLRQEWGFKGNVVSDYYAIPQMQELHHVAGSKAEAAKQAIEAGVDIELPDPDTYPLLVQLVNDGKVSEALIDKAVARSLRLKFLLGLFENPYVDPTQRASTNAQDIEIAASRRAQSSPKNETI